MAELRLDLRGQDLAENIPPAVVGGNSDSVAEGTGRKRRSAGSGLLERGEKIDAGMAVEGLGHGQDFRLFERIGDMAAKAQVAAVRGGNRARQKPHAILDQSLIGFARAIPFEHGEFGMVKPSPFAVAEHMREGKDALFARGEQFLDREFRRAMQIKC
jgi:hypothetical protein